MAYKVIKNFRDRDNKLYSVGDDYKGTKARVAVLSTDDNAYKVPFIKEVKEQKKQADKEAGD